MKSLRLKLVVQTQSVEPDSRALCGMLSINNALQQRNYLDMDQMREELCIIEKLRPGEDHGCPKNGHYSILAFQHVLRKRGYNLVHLNFVQFLYSKSKKEWPERLVRSSFDRLLIIGQPQGQVGNIYHCIASTTFKGERFIIDPDEGQRAPMTEDHLRAFLPKISSVYAILTGQEMEQYKEMFKRAKERAKARRDKTRMAKQKRFPTLRQHDVAKNKKATMSKKPSKPKRKVAKTKKSKTSKKIRS